MATMAASTDVLFSDDQAAIAAARTILAEQRAAFDSEPVPTVRERKRHLKALAGLIRQYEGDIIAALQADFGCRSAHETRIVEVLGSLATIKYLSKRLRKWAKPRRRHTSIWFLPGGNKVVWQPKGVVGIMSPWNFPVHLTVAPLASALAAGNRVMIKMSEHTPHTTALLKNLIGQTFPRNRVAVIDGDAELSQAFAGLAFDHLLFTGSTAVGRAVMRAAAENLTPVTLELGGKSPAVVDTDYSVKEAAARIVWGKLFNAGQICIAPDYAFVPHDKVELFQKHALAKAARSYPELVGNDQFTAVINDDNYRRLQDLVADAETKGATIQSVPLPDGAGSGERKFPLTLVTGISEDMRIAREEIFGPILPILPYRTQEEVVSYINRRDRPLALYVFGKKRKRVRHLLSQTVSGGVSINDTLLHYLQDDLPFGGTGHSGIGSYHGREGFETFSHKKAVFTQRGFGSFTGAKLLYPPYGRLTDIMIRIMQG